MQGEYSYAVAWVSKRDDGNPYEYTSKLQDLGLTHDQGYRVTVSYLLLANNKTLYGNIFLYYPF